MQTSHLIGWWTCAECGVEAELPASDTAGFVVACPDCDAEMVELWSWEPAADPEHTARPARSVPRAA